MLASMPRSFGSRPPFSFFSPARGLSAARSGAAAAPRQPLELPLALHLEEVSARARFGHDLASLTVHRREAPADAPRAAPPPLSVTTAPIQRAKQRARKIGFAATPQVRSPHRIGKDKRRRDLGVGASRRLTYTEGQHGNKKREQKRLSSLYHIAVSGTTHESEHSIGFEPINRSSGLKRGKASRARALENRAPAYQEVKALHRQHIGTGSRSVKDLSGFNAAAYREAQRKLIEAGDVSSAVQLNQLGYAFAPTLRSSAGTPKGKAATDSYDTMVKNFTSLTYAQGDTNQSVSVSPTQQAEMHLARSTAISGKWPTAEEIESAKKLFGK
jgi:hypothetical protein